MPRVGGHVSAAVSLELSFDKALTIGADCTQIFISPPQMWVKASHDDEEIERYRNKAVETGIGPNFIHGTYLVNLGTKAPEHLAKSIDWLQFAMQTAGKLGVRGVIFHLGSHKGAGFEAVEAKVIESLKKVLESSPEGESAPKLILETSAGAGGNIGGTFAELGRLIKGVNDERLGICIDTQHVFAAGYDMRTPLTIKDVIKEFDEEIGLKNLYAFHANDSKVEFKSGKDRHENIGEGFIGKEGFETIINQPEFKDIPFILEVPGFTGSGPDAENVTLLKSLMKNP